MPVTGRLTASLERVELEGRSGDRLVTRTIDHRELAGVRIVRTGSGLLYGRPTLVVERHDAPSLLVRPLGPGLLHELADLFSRLCALAHRVERIAVVLPLKADAVETARALVAEGPPFDPESASLARHEVFITDREAIFVFSGADACESVREIMRTTSVWPAAGRWSLCLDGPPRLAETAYAWPRSAEDPPEDQRSH